MTGPTAGTTNAHLLRQVLAHLDRHEVGAAEGLLAHILSREPLEPGALQLMGVVRRMQGKTQEAEDYYRRSLAIDPNQPQVHHNLGNLLASQHRMEDAIAQYGEAIRLKPNYVEAHLSLALALSAKGDHSAAEKSCRQALRVQPHYRLAKQTLAAELIELNRAQEAEQILRQMLALGTNDRRAAATIEHNLGVALKQQERFHDALAMFDAAQAKDPEIPAVDYNRGNTLQQLGELERAAQCYRRALARAPTHVDALANLALVSALTNEFADAGVFGERVIALDPHNPIGLIALSIVDIEQGAFASALARLRHVLDQLGGHNEKQTSFALGFAADAFDRHGRTGEAFALQSYANKARRNIYSGEFQDHRAIDDVNRLIAHFESCDRWSATPDQVADDSGTKGHVFVLGFMRAGTTLLQTVLSSNPQIVSIDEIEFLTNASREFLLSESGLRGLAVLDAGGAARWQRDYWKSVRNSGLSISGRVFLDKMPFNSLRLPLISRLFPEAKILFAVRDPRDVVLSCFRRRFNPTPFSFEFFELDDCARFYASAMTLVERYREKLPLNLREHRYEDMVADFDSTVRRVCEFVGIEWNDSMRDFGGAASAIDRRSASAAQVRRGLYQEGVGQWRRYREQLTPVLPILEPWIARFGYPKD